MAASPATSSAVATSTAAVGSISLSSGRVIVIPVSDCLEEATHVLDWYAANVRGANDRLVLVRLLVPDCPPPEEQHHHHHHQKIAPTNKPKEAAAVARKSSRRAGGSAGSSAAASSTSSEDSDSSGSSTGSLMEAQMARQLEASVGQEARLVRRLRERGLRSFRFIHAFGRQFTDCLLTIAAEQGACAVLAPLSAFAADHDLARTYYLYKKARMGIIHVPDCC